MKSVISKVTIWLVALAWCGNLLYTQPWRGDYGVINNDVISYYSYLPAAFIYQDLTFQFVDDLDENTRYRIWYLSDDDGKRYQKMSLGASVMYLPFFLLAHGWASMTSSFEATGYTFPYQLLLCLSSIFYAVLGLVLLRRILLKYFDEIACAITLFSIGLATNLYYYTSVEGPMTHAYNFFLFTLVLYQTLKWHESPSYKSVLILGLGIGLAGIIRPTNLIVALVPLLYGISNVESLKIKSKLVLQHWKHLAVLIGTTFLCAIPLMLYWKYTMGSYIYYSYTGEGFFFNNPKLIDGLVGFRKGWLVYTPIMVFSLVGMFGMSKVRSLRLAIPVFFVLNYYIILSWWCWWYGGSFGLRTLIDSYGILAVPLCAFYSTILSKRKIILTGTLATCIVALTYLNVFQVWQYRITLLHWDSMSKTAYENIFLKKTWPEGYDQMLEPPDYEKAKLDEEGF